MRRLVSLKCFCFKELEEDEWMIWKTWSTDVSASSRSARLVEDYDINLSTCFFKLPGFRVNPGKKRSDITSVLNLTLTSINVSTFRKWHWKKGIIWFDCYTIWMLGRCFELSSSPNSAGIVFAASNYCGSLIVECAAENFVFVPFQNLGSGKKLMFWDAA